MIMKKRYHLSPTMKLIAVLSALWAISCVNPARVETAAPPNNPVEVGDVNWRRDYQDALRASRQTGKPIFLLFQEVPGCIGCQNFGRQALTQLLPQGSLLRSEKTAAAVAGRPSRAPASSAAADQTKGAHGRRSEGGSVLAEPPATGTNRTPKMIDSTLLRAT